MKKIIVALTFAVLMMVGLAPANASSRIGSGSPDLCQTDSGDSSYPSHGVSYGWVDGFGNYHGDSKVYPGDCSGSRAVSTVKVPYNRKFLIDWRSSSGATGTRWVNGNIQPNIDLRNGTKIVVRDVDNV